MEVRAMVKCVRISLTKVGAALNLMRGKNIREVFTILQYAPEDAAAVINEVLKSAAISAESNHEMDVERLHVAEAFAGTGSTLKRLRPVDYGKAFRINRGTGNIISVVKGRA